MVGDEDLPARTFGAAAAIDNPADEGLRVRTVTYTQADIDKLPNWQRGEEVVVADFRHRIERAHVLQARWLLWLAVANAAALAALGSKQLDALSKAGNEEAFGAFALIQPAMWFFFIGLIFAAIAGLKELLDNMKMAKALHNSIRVLQHDPHGTSHQPFDYPTWRDWFPEIVSAACFLGGLAYPLVVLGIRYAANGHFIW